MQYIFNGTNLLVLIIFALFAYGFWSPYLKGKKYQGVVEGYTHPEKDKQRDLHYVCKFMYRDEKGRRKYCLSKRVFETQGEAIKLYPKGKKVDLRVYKESRGDINDLAKVTSDGGDLRYTIFLTVAALVCCSAVSVAVQLYEYLY